MERDKDNPHAQDDEVIGRAFRGSLAVLGLAAALIAGVVMLRSRNLEEVPADAPKVVLPQVRSVEASALPELPFTKVTESAGIRFRHENGAVGQKLLPETMGGGVAFLDYDSDGDQDLFFVNSSRWTDDPASPQATSALYANDGRGNFTDVTAAAGAAISCYGMGVATGDYDNDGDPDIFVTAVGKNRLLRNDQGVFADVSETAGVGGALDAWSTSAGWFDFDNDGDLDLLVGNYVAWSPDIDLAQDFRLTGIGRAYGPPFSFQGAYPYLYRNEGDGTFADVSAGSGVQQNNLATDAPLAKTLGVLPIDINRDGWMDVVLANDTVRNMMLINQQDGTFVDTAMEAGVAFDASGKARGAMGIDAGCFRNDDCLGIAIGNFANEMSALYVSNGKAGLFTDDAVPSGLGPQTRGDLCFGLFFFDVDLDGRLDLFAANGHLESEINQVQQSQHYRQPPKLFWNAGPEGSTVFLPAATPPSSALSEPLVGRGAAFADIDSDGDLDVVVTQIADVPALLRNDQQLGHHYMRFRLIGKTCNRDGIGAWVEVQQGTRVMRRQVMPTRSYLSQAGLPVTIGLGAEATVDRVRVYWPGGGEQEVHDVAVDRTTIVVQAADLSTQAGTANNQDLADRVH